MCVCVYLSMYIPKTFLSNASPADWHCGDGHHLTSWGSKRERYQVEKTVAKQLWLESYVDISSKPSVLDSNQNLLYIFS